MKPILVVILLVVAVAAIDSSEYTIEWIDYRLAREPEAEPEPEPETEVCDKVGFKCLDCDVLIYCNYINGVWEHKKIEDCSIKGQSCNIDKCSTTPSTECDHRQFGCTSLEGIYPDPATCKKFHYCVPKENGLEHFGSKCGKGYGYNYRTTYCDKKLGSNDTCQDYPVPLCKDLGETAALKDNPSLYYVCLPYNIEGNDPTLYPFLYLCPNGELYDIKTKLCVEKK